MNEYDIIDEFGYDYPLVMEKIIDKTLETEKVKNAVFSVVFVDEDKIKSINNDYRGIFKVTDVISFAFEDNGKLNIDIRNLGDIFICIPKMIEQAKEYGHSETREICFLCVHGILHLLGYDHMNEIEEKIMIEKQELVLNEFEETKRKK